MQKRGQKVLRISSISAMRYKKLGAGFPVDAKLTLNIGVEIAQILSGNLKE
jgi:hypothetical protein